MCFLSDNRSYALSIRDFNNETREVTIKHYRIRKMDDGRVYISPRRIFSNLLELVDHYRRKQQSDDISLKILQKRGLRYI